MTYDPEADALTFRLSEALVADRLSEALVAESEEVAPNVILDFDAEGRVVGIEMLFVSELPDVNPMELAFRVHRERAEAAA
ncbi:MAG: DUF2283 domain-containing protein [Geminicoccaceae bacterium]